MPYTHRNQFALLAFVVFVVAAAIMLMRTTPPGAGAESPLTATYTVDGHTYALSGERTTVFESEDGEVTTNVSVFGEPTFGDLDGDSDEDAVLLLTVDAGGSGTFYYAALAVRTEDGSYTGSAAVLLGDRVAPQTVEVRDGQAIVNYADRGEGEDFSVSPSFGKSLYLSVVPGTTETRVNPTDDPALIMLRAKPWVWTGTHMNDGSTTTPKQPEAFTVNFDAGGRVAITTDCNAMSGTYDAGDSRLVFGALASTKMFCEGSQEQEFAKKLAEVQSFLFVDGALIMEIKYDSGTMTFR